MPLQRFLIAPLKSGLQRDNDPWLIMDDAWSTLENVRVWRGKLKKRFGAYSMNPSKSDTEKQLFSRLRINVGTTDGAGALAVVVPGTTFKIGQIFSCGTEIYTVNALGAPAALLSTSAATATYNTGTGAFVLAGGPVTTAVYFYPAEPVMALPSYESIAVNNEVLFGFDTQFAYRFVKALGWQIEGPIPPAAGSGLWTGTNTDFHSTVNFRGATADLYILFVVNGVVADQIQYFDGTNWTKISPVYDSVTGNVIRTARIVLSFKDRLLLLYTTEQTAAGDKIFSNRVRFSQIGDPTIVATSWDEIISGRGGFIDTPTREAIVSAQTLKDRLVIFCERSTWELIYTGNEAEPFRFQKLDNDLGVESKNSIISFDKVLLGMGSTGLHACNGMNVERIDEQIPDEVFDITNQNDGAEKVVGVKDYYTEEVYWSYSSSAEVRSSVNNVYPNTILVFNYKTSSWSMYRDSITAFGYYQNEGFLVWQDLTLQWQENTNRWSDPSLQSLFRNVIGGNQEGMTFVIDNDKSSNAISLSITDITFSDPIVTLTIIDHNLNVGDFIYLQNIQSGGAIFDALNDAIYRVDAVNSANEIEIFENNLVADTYEGAGTALRVSRINMVSKQYNFYNQVGRKVQTPQIDFLFNKAENGQIQFDSSISFSDDLSLTVSGANTNLGTNLIDFSPLTTIENVQDKIWRSVYPFLEGDTIQYTLAYSQDQMVDESIAFSSFQLNAIMFYVRATDNFGS